MGTFDRDNAAEAKDAISRGNVNEAMNAAERDVQTEKLKEHLSSQREHGGLDNFKK